MAAVERQDLVPRFARGLIDETLADTPITVVQGARQVGKSTLARDVGADARYISLDSPAAAAAARNDPASFVRQSRGLLVIDEVQRIPELLLALKDTVDEDRRPGRFLITGSADLLRVPGTEESLAGRAETVTLYGLSRGEIEGRREDFVELLMSGNEDTLAQRESHWDRSSYLEIICSGSYPEPMRRKDRRRNAWFDNYVDRIVRRDAEELSRLRHLDRLPALLQVLAANNAGELVKSRVADDADIPRLSVDDYIGLLETLFLVHRLPAWGNNLTARVTGRPKVALLDTGLAARLINVTPEALGPHIDTSSAAGPLFEAFVAGELRRQLVWSESDARLFHFRDRNGLEVDLVLEDGSRTVAGIEVKATRTVSGRHFRGLEALRDRLGRRFSLGVLLYAGPEALKFGDRLWALPLSALWSA